MSIVNIKSVYRLHNAGNIFARICGLLASSYSFLQSASRDEITAGDEGSEISVEKYNRTAN